MEDLSKCSQISHVTVLGDESSCRSSRLSGLSATCTPSEVSKEDSQERAMAQKGLWDDSGPADALRVSHADVVQGKLEGAAVDTSAYVVTRHKDTSVVL